MGTRIDGKKALMNALIRWSLHNPALVLAAALLPLARAAHDVGFVRASPHDSR